MATSTSSTGRLTPRPLPDSIRTIQPGGGLTLRWEEAWGSARRWFLRTFRPGYVRRMRECRRGDAASCQHEILDPRDLKLIRNQCDVFWEDQDDPFRWRRRIPLAGWGFMEMLLGGGVLALATVVLWFTAWYLAWVPLALLVFVFAFFRDPPRRISQEPNILVAPADGKLAEITRLEHHEFVDGPAVRIGIFLSVFNVHVNRIPERSRVVALDYHAGKFLNALNPQSAVDNEAMWIGLEGEDPPHRRIVVRQIAGAIARRIVCTLRPGQILERGERLGMIKFGSRTELIVPDEPGLEILVQVGDHIRGGATVMCRYSSETLAE